MEKPYADQSSSQYHWKINAKHEVVNDEPFKITENFLFM